MYTDLSGFTDNITANNVTKTSVDKFNLVFSQLYADAYTLKRLLKKTFKLIMSKRVPAMFGTLFSFIQYMFAWHRTNQSDCS